MKIGKTIVTAAVLVLLVVQGLTGAAWAQQAERIIEAEGTIRSLDFARNEVVIDGVVYGAALDVEVEIRGSYGAFTMLAVGMKVNFEFAEYSPTERVIFSLEQLPDNHRLEES